MRVRQAAPGQRPSSRVATKLTGPSSTFEFVVAFVV